MTDVESDQSDIVIKSNLPKKKVKLPTSPVDNLQNHKGKATTKTMIHEALTELKSRKGVSLHAIKKFLIKKHSVDAEKINFLIKKTINTGVKDGSIIQLKGIGASGSFKLAPVKPPKAKPKEKKPEKTKIEKKTESGKPKKEKKAEPEKAKKEKKREPETKTKKTKSKKGEEKSLPTKKDSNIEKKKGKQERTTEEMKKSKKEKVSKKMKVSKTDKKSKMAASQTPLKKKAASIKIRRSIGNIIKPPKMNPKSS